MKKEQALFLQNGDPVFHAWDKVYGKVIHTTGYLLIKWDDGKVCFHRFDDVEELELT
jgi:hypothetical protein